VTSGRITAKGYGIENPVADNNTAQGRAKNRRVEFKVEF
jgi:outer membrane protein OmpA-like peptidoglycan-associated protein